MIEYVKNYVVKESMVSGIEDTDLSYISLYLNKRKYM